LAERGYYITFRGVNLVGPVTAQIEGQVTKLTQTVRLYSQEGVEAERRVAEQTRMVTAEIEESTRRRQYGYVRALRSQMNLIFGVQMSLFYVSMLAGAVTRLEAAQLTLTDAQEDYERALRRYGPTHERTISALRRLQRVQSYVNRAWIMSTINVVGLVLQFGNLAMRVGITSAVTGGYTASVVAATAADTAHTAVLQKKAFWLGVVRALAGPVGWAMLIGAGIAIGAAGMYLWGRMGAGAASPTTINIEGARIYRAATDEELEEALEKYKEETIEEYRRQAR